MHRTALFSRDRTYRYRLGPRWGDGAAVCFVLLNPSIADATKDDATVRRCIGFARSLGYGVLEVVNLYAPAECVTAPGRDGSIDPGGACHVRGTTALTRRVSSLVSGRFRATALVYEAKIHLPSGTRSDPIAVLLNHRDRHSTVRFFPYRLLDDRIEIGEAQTTESDASTGRRRR